ncbi:MAG TPA: hypothetical protein VH619_05050 [Verrucomicrobiae bacterium]|jgi:excisionase family DNA binding protein|nr:hypothetical protein [Verrucomicrobiae bacterium]
MNQSAAIPLAQYPALMTVRQVADYLAVSQGHVTNLIDCGSLEAINVASPGASRAFLSHRPPVRCHI